MPIESVRFFFRKKKGTGRANPYSINKYILKKSVEIVVV